LYNNDLNNIMLVPFATALPRCPGLWHLRLWGNIELKAVALHYLATLGGLRGFERLDLLRCAIECAHVTRNAARFVSELPRCPRRVLNLSENKLGDTFVRALTRALPECASLESLDLAETQISDAGVRALTAGVRLCP
jgi:hypothetical protein